MRNPFTFAFQPGTGRLYINDVGQSSREEINDGAAGRNYGWPNVEGDGSFSPSIGTYSNPVSTYDHGNGCAITGGAFYNPSNPSFPSGYVGKYFFADYCGNWIHYIDPANPGSINNFADGLSSPVDVQVGPDQALYYVARGDGAIRRIQYTVNTAPTISQQPSSITVSQGATATFTISASGSPSLSYQWERAASGSSTFVGVGSSNSASYTTPSTSASDNGAKFRAVVSNSAGSATSNSATLTVTSNTPPSVTISSPTSGSKYNGGSVINYAGSATDTQDGNEPASRFSWTVLFHHQSHTHPFLGPITNQSSGSFTIPVTGEPDAVQWYEIILTVSDSAGLATTVSRRIDPNTANFTLASNPAGLQLTLDSQPLTASQTITGVVGMTRTLGVVSPQTVGSSTYAFTSWSDGGSASHSIATLANATTYTANFQTTTLDPIITAAALFNDGAGAWSGLGNTADKAYDGNTGTFYDCANGDNGYTGVDVGSGKTAIVTAIRYWARGSFAYRMVGGVFEGSNTQTSGYVSLGTVATASDNGWTTLAVNGAAAYRYLRYRGPNSGYCNVAEIEFHGSVTTAGGGGTLDPIITAATRFDDGAGAWSGLGNTADKAYDGNTGTFYDCANGDGGYTGIDVGNGKTAIVTAIRYWARGGFANRMNGGVFEGSSSQTSGYVSLGTVTSASDSGWTTLTVNGAAAYRYLRYRGPNSGFCNVAEIEFHGSVTTAGGGTWTGATVGTATNGSFSESNDVITVNGSGSDFWNTADGGFTVSQALTGDASMVARVSSLQNTDPWAKAGVMIRQDTSAGSVHAFCAVTAGNGVAFQRRTTANGSSDHTAGSSSGAPRWVKLVRQSATLTAFESADGANWTQIGSTTISMSNPVRIGLAVTSHADGTLCQAVFDNVVITPMAAN